MLHNLVKDYTANMVLQFHSLHMHRQQTRANQPHLIPPWFKFKHGCNCCFFSPYSLLLPPLDFGGFEGNKSVHADLDKDKMSCYLMLASDNCAGWRCVRSDKCVLAKDSHQQSGTGPHSALLWPPLTAHSTTWIWCVGRGKGAAQAAWPLQPFG